MKNVLVICTGNICRSPTAEYLLRRDLGDGFDVQSAGLGAVVDSAADPLAEKIAESHGVSLDGHKARQVNQDMLKWADLVLTMEERQKEYLLQRYPYLEGKVFRYGDPVRVDIPDPYGRPESAFVMAWKFIEKFTPYWVDKIRQNKV